MVQVQTQAGQTTDQAKEELKTKPLPGRYHVVINTGREGNSKDKGTLFYGFDFQCLNGTVPGQVGKVIDEKFWITEAALPRLTVLALACGALQPGQSADLQPDHFGGRQLIIDVIERKYSDQGGNPQTTVELAYDGMWEVGHPEVKDVPKDQNAIQQIGQLAQQPAVVGGPPVQQGQPPQQPQPVQGIPPQVLVEQSPQPAPVATPPQQQPPQQTAPPAAPPATGDNWIGVQ